MQTREEPGRPSWQTYFVGVAYAVAARGECRRSQVGAVLVRDNRIIATGYNGVAAGAPSCLDGVCPREQAGVPRSTPYAEAPCIATHAEVNAYEDALRRGLEPGQPGDVLYLTKEPCEDCRALLQGWRLPVWWYDETRLTGGRVGV